MEIDKMRTWGQLGREITQKLEGTYDEALLEAVALDALREIRSREHTYEGQDKALKQVSREILKKFPRRETQTKGYWLDEGGRKDLPKCRHNIFKHLTLGRGIKPSLEETEQPANPPADKTAEQTLPNLETMPIEVLELDAETQQILSTALIQSGMSLPDFIRQAVKVYAKTITGKNKQQSEDLSHIPTQDLLDDPKYSTHPGRADELTKRTIRAIKYYNASVATENADRWCITQSAITTLIGSRASTIGKILESFRDEVETHNQTYNLNAYSNRKRGKDITEAINLAELVPDGLD